MYLAHKKTAWRKAKGRRAALDDAPIRQSIVSVSCSAGSVYFCSLSWGIEKVTWSFVYWLKAAFGRV